MEILVSLIKRVCLEPIQMWVWFWATESMPKALQCNLARQARHCPKSKPHFRKTKQMKWLVGLTVLRYFSSGAWKSSGHLFYTYRPEDVQFLNFSTFFFFFCFRKL